MNQTNGGSYKKLAPAAVTHPSWIACPNDLGDMLRFDTGRDLVLHIEQASEETSHLYIEAQFHGQVRLSDIEEMVFLDAPPNKELSKRLDAKNIRWRVAL